MERIEKDKIMRNFADLCSLIICGTHFLSYLVQDGIITTVEVTDIMAIQLWAARFHKLISILLTRTNGFNALVSALQETNQTGAVDILTNCENDTETTLFIDELENTISQNQIPSPPDTENISRCRICKILIVLFSALILLTVLCVVSVIVSTNSGTYEIRSSNGVSNISSQQNDTKMATFPTTVPSSLVTSFGLSNSTVALVPTIPMSLKKSNNMYLASVSTKGRKHTTHYPKQNKKRKKFKAKTPEDLYDVDICNPNQETTVTIYVQNYRHWRNFRFDINCTIHKLSKRGYSTIYNIYNILSCFRNFKILAIDASKLYITNVDLNKLNEVSEILMLHNVTKLITSVSAKEEKSSWEILGLLNRKLSFGNLTHLFFNGVSISSVRTSHELSSFVSKNMDSLYYLRLTNTTVGSNIAVARGSILDMLHSKPNGTEFLTKVRI